MKALRITYKISDHDLDVKEKLTPFGFRIPRGGWFRGMRFLRAVDYIF